jgi:hypothetical protein
MLEKSKKSAILIGHFILTNVFLPLMMFQLGKDLYDVWFKK